MVSSQTNLFPPATPVPIWTFLFKTSCLENLVYGNNLTSSVPASLEPCAPLSDDLLVQHQLSILGMIPLAASFGRCLLTLEPECVKTTAPSEAQQGEEMVAHHSSEVAR